MRTPALPEIISSCYRPGETLQHRLVSTERVGPRRVALALWHVCVDRTADGLPPRRHFHITAEGHGRVLFMTERIASQRWAELRAGYGETTQLLQTLTSAYPDAEVLKV